MVVACAARQTPAPIEYLLRKAGLGQEESMPSSGRLNFMSQRTPELSDAGGPERPHWQLTWPVHVRSSDFVGHGYSLPICNAREMSSVAVGHKGGVFLSTAA